jgi:release factor glutamine methyltransferase
VSSPAPESLTTVKALRRIRDHLRATGIEEPDLEAELLLRAALRSEADHLPSKAWLYRRPDALLDAATEAVLEALLARRLAGEPSAYITGVREFRGLDFEVSPDVLIPRPETEMLVEHATAWARAHVRSGSSPVVADIGTGSGAIAVALARELPQASVIATDVSWGALTVAARNARRHGVEAGIAFRHGDLLVPVDRYVDLIVANLPYVTEADWRTLAPEVREHEPALALRGGDDGLLLIGSLLLQAPRYLRSRGAICLEFGAGQKNALIDMAQILIPGARIEVAPDFAGIPRVLTVHT